MFLLVLPPLIWPFNLRDCLNGACVFSARSIVSSLTADLNSRLDMVTKSSSQLSIYDLKGMQGEILQGDNTQASVSSHTHNKQVLFTARSSIAAA